LQYKFHSAKKIFANLLCQEKTIHSQHVTFHVDNLKKGEQLNKTYFAKLEMEVAYFMTVCQKKDSTHFCPRLWIQSCLNFLKFNKSILPFTKFFLNFNVFYVQLIFPKGP